MSSICYLLKQNVTNQIQRNYYDMLAIPDLHTFPSMCVILPYNFLGRLIDDSNAV